VSSSGVNSGYGDPDTNAERGTADIELTRSRSDGCIAAGGGGGVGTEGGGSKKKKLGTNRPSKLPHPVPPFRASEIARRRKGGVAGPWPPLPFHSLNRPGSEESRAYSSVAPPAARAFSTAARSSCNVANCSSSKYVIPTRMWDISFALRLAYVTHWSGSGFDGLFAVLS